MALLVPSLVAADFGRLGEALQVIKAAGAKMAHVDIMDGHFVPDISLGPPVFASLRRATDLVMDVHLLMEHPERYLEEFIERGADRVSFQAEATPHLRRVADAIRERGAQAGVALNPGTSLALAEEVLEDIDFLVLLTAEPGLKEGTLVPTAAQKIRDAARKRTSSRLNFQIQAEGGITPAKLEDLVRAGADILVAGSAIFHNGDPGARLAEMIRQASVALDTSRA